MKRLKFLIVMIVMCLIVPVMSQAQGSDTYIYKADPNCDYKITLTAGDTDFPINYRLTYNGAASVGGTVDNGGVAVMQLPRSSQWYQLIVERADVDKTFYTVGAGCERPAAGAQMAPSPVIAEDKWVSVQGKLKQFFRLIDN
jgi:hypothetical protein